MSLIQLHKSPDIFNIKVPLPNNPLRDLNVYVIVSDGEAMVIDTGFRKKECHKALTEGLKELAIPMERIRLFITHMHSDHAGQADVFAKAGCPVYLNQVDISLLRDSVTGGVRDFLVEKYRRHGYPEEDLKQSLLGNPLFANTSLGELALIPVEDKTTLKVGSLELHCVQTSGHTPGHTCLYLKEAGIIFSGDHLLYDITPNIATWEGVPDSLGNYIDSLRKLDDMPFKIAYPAHRELHDYPHERIRELIEHHKTRLDEVISIVCRYSGIPAYKVASLMKWSIRCNGWEDFPANQKWFAVGEGLAHLDWLQERDYVEYRVQEDGQILVYPKDVRSIVI